MLLFSCPFMQTGRRHPSLGALETYVVSFGKTHDAAVNDLVARERWGSQVQNLSKGRGKIDC